jgi:hypothetical protein
MDATMRLNSLPETSNTVALRNELRVSTQPAQTVSTRAADEWHEGKMLGETTKTSYIAAGLPLAPRPWEQKTTETAVAAASRKEADENKLRVQLQISDLLGEEGKKMFASVYAQKQKEVIAENNGQNVKYVRKLFAETITHMLNSGYECTKSLAEYLKSSGEVTEKVISQVAGKLHNEIGRSKWFKSIDQQADELGEKINTDRESLTISRRLDKLADMIASSK